MNAWYDQNSMRVVRFRDEDARAPHTTRSLGEVFLQMQMCFRQHKLLPVRLVDKYIPYGVVIFFRPRETDDWTVVANPEYRADLALDEMVKP